MSSCLSLKTWLGRAPYVIRSCVHIWTHLTSVIGSTAWWGLLAPTYVRTSTFAAPHLSVCPFSITSTPSAIRLFSPSLRAIRSIHTHTHPCVHLPCLPCLARSCPYLPLFLCARSSKERLTHQQPCRPPHPHHTTRDVMWCERPGLSYFYGHLRTRCGGQSGRQSGRDGTDGGEGQASGRGRSRQAANGGGALVHCVSSCVSSVGCVFFRGGAARTEGLLCPLGGEPNQIQTDRQTPVCMHQTKCIRAH